MHSPPTPKISLITCVGTTTSKDLKTARCTKGNCTEGVCDIPSRNYHTLILCIPTLKEGETQIHTGQSATKSKTYTEGNQRILKGTTYRTEWMRSGSSSPDTAGCAMADTVSSDTDTTVTTQGHHGVSTYSAA